jgi:hypothetical protein
MLQASCRFRWLPIPLYLWEREDAALRVDQKVKKCVVFLGAEDRGRFVPYGSGFVGIVKYGPFGFEFVVTAKHVVDDIPGPDVVIRLNKWDGKADTFKLSKHPHFFFQDRAIDVALLPVNLDPAVHDYFCVPLDRDTWEKERKAGGDPAEGDEVSIVGLYTSHYGYESNITIVRIGHIAALPGERVMTDRGYVFGYLIGTHSIAGHSGSPVFLNLPPLRVKNQALEYLSDGEPTHLPLGILIGHHVVETKEDEIFVPQFQTPMGERSTAPRPPARNEERRTGFAVAVSLDVIFRLFEEDGMKTIMQKSVENAQKGFKSDSARPAAVSSSPGSCEQSSDANPRHLEDFKRLVDVAARKRPQDDQT